MSVSYERENLLSRGLGLEHLRELVIALARPLLRQGVSLAYAGHWKEAEDNFTYELLRIIAAEQEDSRLAETNVIIGGLYNHCAWPNYLTITPRIEAQWINCCRIIRVSQKEAEIADSDAVADGDAEAVQAADRVVFNKAVVLSAMRRLMVDGMEIGIPDAPSSERVPPLVARVLLGGKVESYSGFLPGIFEEMLLTTMRGRAVYVLGGFGGAAERLARALLSPDGARPPELTPEWHLARNPNLVVLDRLSSTFTVPAQVQTTRPALDALYAWLQGARLGLATALKTGLDEAETREMLATRNMARAVQLVRKGLEKQVGLKLVPA